jgi:hypothetical protein
MLVGRLEDYDFYNPFGSGDEADWNLFIRPNSAHTFIRDQTLSNADSDELHRAADGVVLVEAEVTPDESFYNNPYFNANGRSTLVGREIGVYGPWVTDRGHRLRPEIHPCELLGWQAVGSLSTVSYLMIVQDDSNRFDRRNQFLGAIARPWAGAPRAGQFDIVVSIPANATRKFEIEEVYNHQVQESAPQGPRDLHHAVGASSHIIVERNISNPRHVEVAFVEFITTAPSQMARGFLRLTTKVGVDSRGKEGYHVIRVTETVA